MARMDKESGQVAKTPQEQQALVDQGFLKCRNPVCSYFLSPEELSDAEHDDHFFSCPSCKLTYPLMDSSPFQLRDGGVTGTTPVEQDPNGFIPGVKNRNWETKIGLSMKEQGDLAEKLVQEVGEFPPYGPITWWSPVYNCPIDGGIGEWGVEVKALCIDVKNDKFIITGNERKQAMIDTAKALGFKAILGIGVILDYRRSVADIYTKEMPFEERRGDNGQMIWGPISFRPRTAVHFAKEVPFDNPFLNPHHEEPQAYDHTGDDIPF